MDTADVASWLDGEDRRTFEVLADKALARARRPLPRERAMARERSEEPRVSRRPATDRMAVGEA